MMPPLPPLNLSSSASSALGQNGTNFMVSGPGDWNVNLGGGGTAYQSSGSAPPVAPLLTSVVAESVANVANNPLLLIALTLGVVWLVKKR